MACASVVESRRCAFALSERIRPSTSMTTTDEGLNCNSAKLRLRRTLPVRPSYGWCCGCASLSRMPRLVECVPNVSEGRRGDVIDRLADAIRAVDGVRLLDRTSDVDHNRSVFTYAGEPDAVVHATAGAIVVGARPFLIAFNIELDSTDLKLAQRIAKEIRESSGGLPAVQARGFMLTDPPRVQVSMNLLDHTTTSLATVWREVETRANAAGVRVLRGELIGLLPLDAALQVTAGALKLDDFTRDRVIESHFLE